MDHNERIKLITSELNDFLRRFSRADHLSNDQALLELKSMAVAINKRMMAGLDRVAVLDRLGDAFQEVVEIWRGRDWPKVAVFVTAMENINKRVVSSGVAPKSDWSLDPIQIAADRMNAGEAVGDNWIYGRDAVALIKTGQVSADTMRQYRSALYFGTKRIVQETEAKRREQEWIKRHEEAEKLDINSQQGNRDTSGIVGAVSGHLRHVDRGAS